MKRFPRISAAALALVMVLSCSGGPGPRQLSVTLHRTLDQTSELGVVEYKLHKVVRVSDSEWYKIGDRKLLYSLSAYIKAGVDLREFSPDDVAVSPDRKEVTVVLPPAKILSIDIPPEEIRLEYEHVSRLRANFSPEEKSAVLQEGERQIRDMVPSLDILPRAEDGARKAIQGILYDMGYEIVNVSFARGGASQ